MKSFGDLKRQLNEAVSPEQQRFDMLVRAGLMDKTLLPKLHRVMDKLHQEKPMSMQERQLVFDLVKQLTQIVSGNMGVFQKVRQAVREEQIQEIADSADSPIALLNKEPPMLIILRRKAIRMYPHDTKVALYYSDKLNRYFTVPFQDTESPK